MLGGNGGRGPPRLVALEQRAAGREQLVEPLVRLREDVFGNALGLDAVAALDLVEIGELLAYEETRVDAEAAQLVAEPAGTRIGESRLRKLRE